MDKYEINNSTLAIIPISKNCSKVIESSNIKEPLTSRLITKLFS